QECLRYGVQAPRSCGKGPVSRRAPAGLRRHKVLADRSLFFLSREKIEWPLAASPLGGLPLRLTDPNPLPRGGDQKCFPRPSVLQIVLQKCRSGPHLRGRSGCTLERQERATR